MSEQSEHVRLLNSIGVTLHARLNGSSALEWTQPSISASPLDPLTSEKIDEIHKGTEETLLGFMQFWTPFIDGSAIPPNSRGVEATRSQAGITLRMKQPDAQIIEVFSNSLILQRFTILTAQNRIDLMPSFDSTDDGLLVSRFIARISNATKSAKPEEMHVEIYYQTIGDFPVPSRINIDAIGKGNFNFKLDNCRVNAGE